MGLIALQFNHGNKRISTRNTGNPETNGFSSAQNGNMTDGQFVETRLNVLDEEANHAGSPRLRPSSVLTDRDIVSY
ncbi:hypothetical protein AVEN_247821-1 [Araneus ventricosus]|uniref:Uncharacterized protein n=1 Tax=Araneus ventricosus TaxID=182803 RepID=A0A4Y2PT87_ARAVE|nr:hypothetical protein AVEN_110744-1 [Araneus ventricosus]GBN53493.1 hypothetical protein AVEN_247821-1 [Araneus ventricosus]